MIVTCEQCTTQFQLDDAKVPARGVRVRCSRCKHAFFVKPHAEADRVVERAVQHALEDEAAVESDAALVEGGGTLSGGAGSLDAGSGSLADGVGPLDDAAEESDWEFNHDSRRADEGAVGGLELDASADVAQDAVDDLLEPPDAPDAPDAELDDGGAGELVPGLGEDSPHDIGDEVDSLLAGGDDALGQASDSGLDLGAEPLAEDPEALGEADRAATGQAHLHASISAEAPEHDLEAQDPSEFDSFEPHPSDARGLDSSLLDDSVSNDSPQSDGGDPDALPAPEASQHESEAAVDSPPSGSAGQGLGSPENWEFFDAEGGDAPDRVMSMRIPLGRLGSSGRRPPVEVEKETSRVGIWLARAVNGVGWTVVAALALAGLRAGLNGDAVPSGPAAQLHQINPSTELTDLTQVWVDNAPAGTLYVLSGKLRGSGSARIAPGTRFEVRLLDAAGEPLGVEPAALGPPLTLAELRTGNPAELRGKLATQANASAWSALAPGDSRRVQAVIPSVPESAARFDVLAVEATPRPGPQPEPAAQEAAPDPTAAPTPAPQP